MKGSLFVFVGMCSTVYDTIESLRIYKFCLSQSSSNKRPLDNCV